MKTIYFIRHAKSSWADNSLADIDRPLNERGLRDAPFMAKLLSGKSVKPDLIVSSPANRAFTTATYFAEAFKIKKKDIRMEMRIYEAWPEDVLDIICSLSDNHHTVLIFGHNPTFTSLANMFSKKYIANISTCGIVEVKAEIDSWSLFNRDVARVTAYYYPKQYF